MFSHCYQIGESIEIFNSQDKKLLSQWGFTGKHSKVYDPNLHNYEMVLSTGNISKMEIPKNSYNNKNKTLSLFQGFIVFQLIYSPVSNLQLKSQFQIRLMLKKD